jgi:hypothetical protein
MSSKVDSMGLAHPADGAATTGIHIPRVTARKLIKDSTMRFTILPLLFITASCIADVGGDQCTGQRCKDGEGSGSGTGSAVGCDDAEERGTNLTIRTAADFDALPKGCWSLNANLRLEGPAITSLARLGELIEVNDLELVDTGLTSLDTRKTIKVYGSLLVSGNTKLTNLNNLAVKRWDGATQDGSAFAVGYTIRNNAQLTAIDGLKYVVQVDKDLRITDNAKLATVELPELTRVTGGVHITGTGATAIRLPVLANVARLEVATNPQLAQISGLAATSISGDVILRTNPVLATIGSMSSLTQIGGALTIDDNDALVDLTNLMQTGMTRISGGLTISNNARLASLGQLSRMLDGINGAVTITGNTTLSTCRAIEIDHCAQIGQVAATISANSGNANNCGTCWCGR